MELHIAFDDDWDEHLWVTLADRMGSLTNLRMAVEPPKEWIADHRNRLRRVRRAWPTEQP